MQSKSGIGNRLEPDPHAIPPTNAYSEPWWRGMGYNPISAPRDNPSSSSSLEVTNGASESNGGQSQSEENDDASKDSQSHQPDGNHGQEQHTQHVAPAVPGNPNEGVTQPSQLELVGHSIACANPYQDPYYAGMVAVYGQPPVGYPPFVGMPQARMPLPLEMTQEPVYVNAKQYQGILRRRQARAKAELEKKLIKARKPYLHESRHQHAMRRARGTGGRFAKKNDNAAGETGTGPHPTLSSHSATSSGSEPSAETWNSSLTRQETNNAPYYQNGSRGEEGGGDCSGQQWGSMSSNQTSSQRPLAIQ